MTALNGWNNFSMIVGSAAGALIGFQFVVMTLLAGMSITQGDAHAGDCRSFGTVLLLSAVVSAP